MSIQRAHVNCKRCYTIAKRFVGKDIRNPIDTPHTDEDQVYTARNEALKGLEETLVNLNQQRGPIYVSNASRTIISQALDACVKCNYSTPAIADLVEKSISGEESE